MTKTNSSSLQNIAYKLYKAKNITFIIGAGASISAGIPSAGEIIEIIFQDYPDIKNKILEEDQKDYGKVMGKLTQEQAVKILQSLLNQAQINWGHICLAHLFEHLHNSEKFNILTFNFDNLLERALSVFGYTKPIYDCAVSPIGKDGLKYLAPKAIFHLHGQNYGLRLLNGEEETGEHKEKLRPLFEQKLQIDRPDIILVAGYSGDSDPALTLIQNAMKENTNTELFWLGYDENPSETLKEAFPEFGNQNNKAHYLGGCDFDRTMLAITQEISKLAETAQENFSWPLTLFTNIPDHALTLMEQFTEYPQRDPETLEARLQSLFNLQAFFIERFTNASKDWKNNNYEKENKYLNIILKDEEPDQEEDKHLSRAALILKSYPWEAKNKHLTFQIRQIINKKNAVQIYLECEKHIKNIEAIRGKEYYNIPIAWAKLYSAMGEHGKAIEELEKAKNNTPESIEIKYAIALELSSSQKEKDADEKFIEASAFGELPPYALENWACALFRLGRFECTIKKFKKAQTQSHKLPINMLVTWGTACLALEKYEEAIEKCDEASLKCEQEIKLGKNLPQNYSEWGRAYTNLGHSILKFKQDDAKAQDYYQKACEKYTQAKKLDCKEPNKEEDKKLTSWGRRLKSDAWLRKAEKLINYLPVSRTRKEDISEIRKSLKNSDIIIGKNALTLSLKYLAFAQDITFKDYLEDFKKAEEKFPTDKDMFNVYGFFLFHYGLHYEKENNEKAIKKYKAACDKFEKSIKLKQEQALIWYVLGNISANIGALTKDSEKLKDACSKYKEATELDNHHPNFWSNWGDTLSQLGDIARDQGNENPHKYYQEACEKYKKSIEFDKNQPNTWFNWGVVLSNMGKINKDIKALSEACNKYKEAIKREQSNITAWGYWGATLYQLGDIAEDSGDIPQAQKYYQDACEKHKKSIELDKNQPEIYNEWGNAIFRLGQIEENSDEYGKAQTYYQKAIEIYKNISDKRTEIHKNNLGRTYLRWGVCLLTLGISKANNTPKEDAIQKLTQAIEKFQNAEELSCKETELYNAQGAAYSQLGDIARDKGDEKALEYYREACKKYTLAEELGLKEPDFYNNWGNTLSNLGDIAQSSGNQQEAQDYYQKACKKYKRAEELGCKEPALYQNWGVALSNLGEISQSSGNQQEAQDYYQKACKKYKQAKALGCKEPNLYNNWGNTLFNLGKIAQGLGNNQEAQDYYKEACEKFEQAEKPGCKDQTLYNNWGIILNLLGAQEGDLGKKSEALNYNKQALEKFKEAISIEQAKENPDQEFIKRLKNIIQQLAEIIERLSSPPNPSS